MVLASASQVPVWGSEHLALIRFRLRSQQAVVEAVQKNLKEVKQQADKAHARTQ